MGKANIMYPILANAGVPMIFLTLPPMVVLILPVILIEFWVARKTVAPVAQSKRWIGILTANLVSTFIGWPLAWGTLLFLEIVTGGGRAHGLDSPIGAILAVTYQAPWLIPYEEHLYWMIPAAMAFLLIPFFLISVYSERWILRRMWKDTSREEMIRFSWVGHGYSYAFLLLVVLIYGVYSIGSR